MPANNEVKIKIVYQEVGKKKLQESTKDLKKLGVQVSKLEKNFKSSLGKTTVAITKQNKATKDLGTESTKQFKKMGLGMTMMAWHMRYLGTIFDRIGRQMIKVIKDTVMVAAELQESFLSIRTAAILYGRDAEKATELSKKLALSGLVPLVESADIVKNLMIGGLGVPEMEKFAYRYLDVAFLMTSEMGAMTKSLGLVTDAILKGTTLALGGDNTAKKLWLDTDKRLQKTLGTSLTALSSRRRAIELLNTIETEYAGTIDLHKIEMETARASMNRLSTSITLIKEALGTALLPLMESAAKSMAFFSTRIQSVLNVLGPAVPVIMATGIAVAFLTSTIFTAGAALISLSRLAFSSSLALWKIYLPILAISAIVMAGTYLFLKYTGALDKVKNSASGINEKLKDLKDTYQGLMNVTEESMEVDEEKAIAHRRKVEDIEEDLARERSKGLWANQMAIKDLEKRLKRENEDWNRHLKNKGNVDEDTNKGLLGNLNDTFNKMEDETKKHIENVTSLWDKLKDPQIWEGVRMAIQKYIGGSVTDPEFWREFWKNFTDNLAKTIVSVGDIVTAIFEGLFGSVMRGVGVVVASAFVISFGKTILALLPFKMAAAGTAAGLAFSAALPATFTITVILLTALAISQALTLRETIQGLWSSAEYGAEVTNKAISGYIKLYKEGKIDIVEFNRLSDEANANQRESIRLAEQGGFWGGIVESSKSPFQFGGIVPGMRGQEVPILAHAGERVIPAGETTNMGGVSININNPIVRNEQDIKEIANQVSKVMGQQQRWKALGG